MGLVDPVSTPVAIRSSATAEDLPTAAFAGMQDTYLNIRGPEALLDHIRRCWASLWTQRAITFRNHMGIDHKEVYISVVVQAMINSEVSGILFTANPVTSNREEVVINASWGLGEAIVSGLVSPDTLTVRKENGQVVSRQTASKDRQIIYAADGGTIETDTPDDLRRAPALSDSQAAELATLGIIMIGRKTSNGAWSTASCICCRRDRSRRWLNQKSAHHLNQKRYTTSKANTAGS
jgi:pyruvate,water dikinase